MTSPPLAREADAAARIARAAGDLAAAWQRRGSEALNVRQKAANAGPVTAADEAAETHIVEALRDAFPGDAILGEEHGAHGDATGARVWMIDPIDGTRDFASGGADWAVHIGLCLQGVPVMGVVYAPIHGDLSVGVCLPSARRATRVDTGGDRHELPELPAGVPSSVRLVTSRAGRSPRTEALAARLNVDGSHHARVGSTGVKLTRLAHGEADLYLYAERKTRVWDTCAPMAIVQAVGGVVTDLHGAPLRHDGPHAHDRGILAASSHALHAWALERLQPPS